MLRTYHSCWPTPTRLEQNYPQLKDRELRREADWVNYSRALSIRSEWNTRWCWRLNGERSHLRAPYLYSFLSALICSRLTQVISECTSVVFECKHCYMWSMCTESKLKRVRLMMSFGSMAFIILTSDWCFGSRRTLIRPSEVCTVVQYQTHNIGLAAASDCTTLGRFCHSRSNFFKLWNHVHKGAKTRTGIDLYTYQFRLHVRLEKYQSRGINSANFIKIGVTSHSVKFSISPLISQELQHLLDLRKESETTFNSNKLKNILW